MTFARSIRIFLIDGDPNMRMSCELSNWTGKAYKIPRTMVKDCADRQDLEATVAVYMLFGKDPKDEEADMVYVGETEEVLKRLAQHVKNKEFWKDAIVVFSKDENLNKAHAKYLEHHLYTLAKDIGRYRVENNSIPTCSTLSEADKAEMDEFLHHLRLMVSTLGYKAFEEIKTQTIPREQLLFIKTGRGADATGYVSPEGFVVTQGSKIALNTVKSVPRHVVRKRKRLVEDGAISPDTDNYVFNRDCVFPSPSAAAAVVMGCSANGLKEWKRQDGLTLKEYEAQQ